MHDLVCIYTCKSDKVKNVLNNYSSPCKNIGLYLSTKCFTAPCSCFINTVPLKSASQTYHCTRNAIKYATILSDIFTLNRVNYKCLNSRRFIYLLPPKYSFFADKPRQTFDPQCIYLQNRQ